MSWKLIEVGEFDEYALTNEELTLLGFLLEASIDKTKSDVMKKKLQDLHKKIKGDILDAASRI